MINVCSKSGIADAPWLDAEAGLSRVVEKGCQPESKELKLFCNLGGRGGEFRW